MNEIFIALITLIVLLAFIMLNFLVYYRQLSKTKSTLAISRKPSSGIVSGIIKSKGKDKITSCSLFGVSEWGSYHLKLRVFHHNSQNN